jgi:hypothetical protein
VLYDTYRQEDIQAILQIAIARQAMSGEFTHSQLQEIAEDLGISSDILYQAEREWVAEQQLLAERGMFKAYRQRRSRQKLFKFLIVNTFLILLDWVTGGGLSWSLILLLLWGSGLTLNIWRTSQVEGEEFERSFQIWRRKRQLQQSMNGLVDRLFQLAPASGR